MFKFIITVSAIVAAFYYGVAQVVLAAAAMIFLHVATF